MRTVKCILLYDVLRFRLYYFSRGDEVVRIVFGRLSCFIILGAPWTDCVPYTAYLCFIYIRFFMHTRGKTINWPAHERFSTAQCVVQRHMPHTPRHTEQ